MEKVVIRRGGRPEDLEGMLVAEHEAWTEEQAFTKEHFLSHLSVFPEGIFIAEVDCRIAGVGISEILKYDINNPVTTWYEVTDEGYLVNSHCPSGNALYGVSLSVSPKYALLNLGEKMIDCAKEFIIDQGLECFVIGSRAPRYYKWAPKVSICDYANLKHGNRYLDPEIEFYSRCGFKVAGILPDYFEDPASLNHGILMVWYNPEIQD